MLGTLSKTTTKTLMRILQSKMISKSLAAFVSVVNIIWWIFSFIIWFTSKGLLQSYGSDNCNIEIYSNNTAKAFHKKTNRLIVAFLKMCFLKKLNPSHTIEENRFLVQKDMHEKKHCAIKKACTNVQAFSVYRRDGGIRTHGLWSPRPAH